MNWRLALEGPARKDLKKIPLRDVKRLEVGLDEIEDNPFRGDIKRLHDKPAVWRRRIGAYRIMYELDWKRDIIRILNIKRRTTTTY